MDLFAIFWRIFFYIKKYYVFNFQNNLIKKYFWHFFKVRKVKEKLAW